MASEMASVSVRSRKETSLQLRIGEGKGLPLKESTGTCNPYCLIKIDKEEVARSSTQWTTQMPQWGEDYHMNLPHNFEEVIVYVLDEDFITIDEFIGKVTITRESLERVPGLEQWYPLCPVEEEVKVRGEVHLDITRVASAGGKERLRVNVIEAKALPKRDGGAAPDPVVVVSLTDAAGSTVDKQTDVRKKNLFPRWDQKFEFEYAGAVGAAVAEGAGAGGAQSQVPTLSVTVHDGAGGDVIGTVTMPVTDIDFGARSTDLWCALLPKRTGTDPKTNLGSIRLKIKFTQDIILPTRFYEPLMQMLLQSIASMATIQSGAIGLLEEVMTDREDVARSLVKIFDARGNLPAYMDAVTSLDIRNTVDPNTLFRGNSLATKSFDQLMKLYGRDYLKSTLQPIVSDVFESKRSCEIDPGKATKADNVEANAVVLRELVERAMEAIFTSASECPMVMRRAFKILQHRVMEKFGGQEAASKDIKYIAVCGFLFLRFFVPAILAPKHHGMRDQHADATTLRTLTLIGKTLQTLGNFGKEVGKSKEDYMKQFHAMIQDKMPRLKSFIDAVVNVPDEELKRSAPQANDAEADLPAPTGGLTDASAIKEGVLLKRSKVSFGRKSFVRRQFRMTPLALVCMDGGEVRARIRREDIVAVEKVDESAFGRKFAMQIVSSNRHHADNVLYVCAADANDQREWISALRWLCGSNPTMRRAFHAGAYVKSRWTCCRSAERGAEGCNKAHPYAVSARFLVDSNVVSVEKELQHIFRQILQGKDKLTRHYLDDAPIAQPSSSLCIPADENGQPGGQIFGEPRTRTISALSATALAALDPEVQRARRVTARELLTVVDDLDAAIRNESLSSSIC